MEITTVIFIISIFLVVYPYGIYQIILVILQKIIRKDIRSDGNHNYTITLIISAFNEEDVIEGKIINTLQIDYPRDYLDILVVSDCSTDKTNEIVQRYADKGVRLFVSEKRQGKTMGLNQAINKTTSDIIVFSDADAIYPQDTLSKIAELFKDQKVGLVTGSTKYTSQEDGIGDTSSFYTKIELFTKVLESKIGSCVGADGALFAIRTKLYKTLNDDDINDLVIPLNVILQGYRVIIGCDIYCIEQPSIDSNREFNRQIRITNRTLRALFRYLKWHNIKKYPIFTFELVSHKLIRLCAPFFMLLIISTNLFLVDDGFIYQLILAMQVVFYSLALIGLYLESLNRKKNRLSIIYHFVLVQISVLLGWANYLMGKKHVTWNTQQ